MIFFCNLRKFSKDHIQKYPFSKMKSIKKDYIVLGGKEEYVSPALEVYSMEMKTSLLLGSPDSDGYDENPLEGLGD